MKLILATIALMVACSSAASIGDVSLNGFWSEFKQQHGKQYTATEEPIKRQIWEDNLKKINKHNLEHSLGQHTYTLKMNKYGDLTHQQFVKLMNTFKLSQKVAGANHFLNASNVEIPDSVDWRTQGYVTPVKDQGQCGSCWAFSTVGSLEGQHFKATGKLVSLSEQNLMDCSTSYGNMGCEGGLMDQAFQYIIANKGIDTEASYPYEAQDANCRFNPANIGATMSSFTDVTSGDEGALTNAIATVGPISVAIDASQDSFQFYSTGVYSDPGCSSTQLDHGVTAVGYGKDSTGQAYYIVKNSWGASWGNQGYIWMARNDNNMCGIATAASFPVV